VALVFDGLQFVPAIRCPSMRRHACLISMAKLPNSPSNSAFVPVYVHGDSISLAIQAASAHNLMCSVSTGRGNDRIVGVHAAREYGCGDRERHRFF